MTKTYEIDRSRWINGAVAARMRNPLTQLYDSNHGRYCCLGLILEQCGYRKSELDGVGTPEKVDDQSMVPAWMTKKNLYGDWLDTDAVREMVNVNDTQNLTEAERERRLTELAQSAGVELRFVGELFPEKVDE